MNIAILFIPLIFPRDHSEIFSTFKKQHRIGWKMFYFKSLQSCILRNAHKWMSSESKLIFQYELFKMFEPSYGFLLFWRFSLLIVSTINFHLSTDLTVHIPSLRAIHFSIKNRHKHSKYILVYDTNPTLQN